MKIVVTGGGTGGHIYPALAVAEAVSKFMPMENILYLGNRTSLEAELIPQQGLPFQGIYFAGMPRKLYWKTVIEISRWLLTLKKAIADSRKLLLKHNPDIVFGTGGYVSAPVLIAAYQLHIPFVVHEPDAHPGLVNRLMARKAAAVTAAFSQSRKYFRNPNFHVTGNPIRGSVGELSKEQALGRLDVTWKATDQTLLITGGSQGARRLNQAVVEALPALVSPPPEGLGLRVLHQTGKRLYEETLAEIEQKHGKTMKHHPSYLIRPYYPEMATVLGAADIAVSRAGSLSLSEMYLCRIPTILIPYPYAAADHQRKNAQASVSSGASLMIPDQDFTGPTLLSSLQNLLSQEEKLSAMREACGRLAHPNATEEILSILRCYLSIKSIN